MVFFFCLYYALKIMTNLNLWKKKQVQKSCQNYLKHTGGLRRSVSYTNDLTSSKSFTESKLRVDPAVFARTSSLSFSWIPVLSVPIFASRVGKKIKAPPYALNPSMKTRLWIVSSRLSPNSVTPLSTASFPCSSMNLASFLYPELTRKKGYV